eukprot:TRINITY_DN9837_c0_g1_i3.p1 TRINITY_DN9837_c0_g1~~TRINITY_DN9837_c0_g1_i3.p1  ORF type:complete len:220 (-),score=-10.56 TRINITY_DN9837_c0_g1_i3:217-876(-)
MNNLRMTIAKSFCFHSNEFNNRMIVIEVGKFSYLPTAFHQQLSMYTYKRNYVAQFASTYLNKQETNKKLIVVIRLNKYVERNLTSYACIRVLGYHNFATKRELKKRSLYVECIQGLMLKSLSNLHTRIQENLKCTYLQSIRSNIKTFTIQLWQISDLLDVNLLVISIMITIAKGVKIIGTYKLILVCMSLNNGQQTAIKIFYRFMVNTPLQILGIYKAG